MKTKNWTKVLLWLLIGFMLFDWAWGFMHQNGAVIGRLLKEIPLERFVLEEVAPDGTVLATADMGKDELVQFAEFVEQQGFWNLHHKSNLKNDQPSWKVKLVDGEGRLFMEGQLLDGWLWQGYVGDPDKGRFRVKTSKKYDWPEFFRGLMEQ